METVETPMVNMLAEAMHALMTATGSGDPAAARAALSNALSAFAVSSADRYDGGIPEESVDYEILESEGGLSVRSLTPPGETLCRLWGDYTREMEYRALQQRVSVLSQVAVQTRENLVKLQKQMDNVLVSFNQIRQKIRF